MGAAVPWLRLQLQAGIPSHFMAGLAPFTRISPIFVPPEPAAGPLSLPLVWLHTRAWLLADDTHGPVLFYSCGDLFVVNVLNCRLYFVLSLS